MPAERKEGPFIVVTPKRAPSIYRGGHMLVSQRGLLELAQMKNLGIQATRVLFALMGTADYENKVMMDAKTVSGTLDMTLPNVYAALKKLHDAGLLQRHPTMRNMRIINGDLAWKGSNKQHREALETA